MIDPTREEFIWIDAPPEFQPAYYKCSVEELAELEKLDGAARATRYAEILAGEAEEGASYPFDASSTPTPTPAPSPVPSDPNAGQAPSVDPSPVVPISPTPDSSGISDTTVASDPFTGLPTAPVTEAPAPPFPGSPSPSAPVAPDAGPAESTAPAPGPDPSAPGQTVS